MAFAAIAERRSAEISGRAAPHFIIGVIPDCSGSDLLISGYRLDEEDGVIGVGGGSVVVIDLELVVATTGHGQVVPPFLEVQLVELVVEDELGRGSSQQKHKQ